MFIRTGNYDILSGVILALTGCEAMFAKYVELSVLLCMLLTNDASLGQFNMFSIRLSFGTFLYPSLSVGCPPSALLY